MFASLQPRFRISTLMTVRTMSLLTRTLRIAAMLVSGAAFCATFALAQGPRGTLVHETTIHVAPDKESAKLGIAERGHEIVVLETTHDWVRVEAILREPSQEDADLGEEAKTISGWISGKALITASTANGDKIIFGEAADSEDEASRRRGRRDAAQDAMRLYYRLYEIFPASPLAAEALYRAADIRWQMDRADVMTRPSARERDSNLRGHMDEELMKQVMKKFPGTKWADLAAFHMIENKLCGDWEGLAKCPEKEAELYEKYAAEHPQASSAPEALYQAASRQAALIEIYRTQPNQKKSDEARGKALALTQKVIGDYSASAWAQRAQRLAFYIQQGVPTYGNSNE
jgi:outer membrane protein assembly factor BamD (BamD/ComL family)